jgi:hypothetical protein
VAQIRVAKAFAQGIPGGLSPVGLYRQFGFNSAFTIPASGAVNAPANVAGLVAVGNSIPVVINGIRGSLANVSGTYVFTRYTSGSTSSVTTTTIAHTTGTYDFSSWTQRPSGLGLDDTGATFLYNKTGNIHKWTGTAWDVAPKNGVVNILDYGAIGDGSADDTAAIQAAINTERSCYFPAGSYKVNGLTLKSNATYYGDGDGTMILLDERGLGGSAINLVFYATLKTGIVIRDLMIKSLNYADVTRPVAYGACGIYLNQSSDCKIQRVTIKQFANWGIYVDGLTDFPLVTVAVGTVSENITIEGCKLDEWSTTRDIGSAFGAIHVGSGTKNVIVRENNVLCAATFGVLFADFYVVGGVADGRCENNVIKNSISYGAALYITNPSPSVANNQIFANNKIENILGSFTNVTGFRPFGSGIYVVGAIGVEISDNVILNTCQQSNEGSLAPGAIGVTNATGKVTITGNTCKTSGYYGIFVRAVFEGLVVSGNNIENTVNEGLFLNTCRYFTCGDNTVLENSDNIRAPLSLRTCKYGTVSGNTVYLNKPSGGSDTVYMDVSDNITITGNTFHNTSTTAISRFINNDYIVLSGNLFSQPDSTNQALSITTKFSNSKVVGNTFKTTRTTKVNLSGDFSGTYWDRSNTITNAQMDNSPSAPTGIVIDVYT